MSSQHSVTVHVSKLPYDATAKDIVQYFENILGSGTVRTFEIKTERNSTKSRGFGFLQLSSEYAAKILFDHSRMGLLVFRNLTLRVNSTRREVKQRPVHNPSSLKNGRLHMGCLVGRYTMKTLWSSTECVEIRIDYSNRRFCLFLNANGKDYKLEWRFSSINEIVACKIQRSSTWSLIVKAWLAPHVYQQLPCPDNIFQEDIEPLWCRTTDFTDNYSIGQSFLFCVEFPQVNQRLLDDLFHKLNDYKLASHLVEKEFVLDLTSSDDTLCAHAYNENEQFASDVHSSDAYVDLSSVDTDDDDTSLLDDSDAEDEKGDTYSSCQATVPILQSSYLNMFPFELVFMLNSLVQQGYLSGPNLGDEFFQMIDPSKIEIGYTKFLLNKLFNKTVTCYEPVKWLKTQMKEYQNHRRRLKVYTKKLDDGLVLVHRLLVTPCRFYCLGPEIEVSNRVTRHFINRIDDFLRVSFVDEDYDAIGSNALLVQSRSSSNVEVTNLLVRIFSILQGVMIGRKRFEFLAFSSSQLRERSVWMFASNSEFTADDIRTWMGDFNRIRNVAKYAARMGQSFSSSTKSLDVHRSEVQEIPDIERKVGNTKYCFSEGIGKISKEFATEVAKKCGYRSFQNRTPSAFQIRYAGYKGVVAVDPYCRYKLALRPSMEKFDSQLTGLDILNWTHFIPCYLNRQVITLLSTLGVPDAVFIEMQGQMTSYMENMFQSGKVALEVLQMFCGGDSHIVMMEMLSSSYHPSREPFLKSMLCAFQAYQLMNLRKKTRIFVSKGRILMGCLDETAKLDYGEVFIKVSSAPGSPHQFFNDGLSRERMCDTSYVVVGKVIVTKNPCVHPGDVRILDAVDIPSLQHMVDCIVFPQQGHRPHPNECSGSDLDGDLYLVSWDERLIPPEIDPPMDYNSPEQQKLDYPVTIEEIQLHFCQYMINDSLGTIANAHTVFADSEPKKARDPKCLALAELCSIAVDFPKTGIPAVLPFNLRPKKYPDFMEKTDKETYKSEQILGKLYRSVKDIDEKLPKFSLSKEDAKKSYDRDLEVPGFEHYLEEAFWCKNMYDEKLIALMNYYDIRSEAEILTGNIISLSRFYRRRPGEVKERIQRAVSSLKKEARSWFEETINNYSSNLNLYEEYAKASAWYHVTYHPDWISRARDEAAADDDSILLSFPWTIYEKLLKIKTGLHHVLSA